MKREVAVMTLAAVSAALIADAAFLALHAWIIVPIWRSFASGLVATTIVAAVIGLAFHFVRREPSLRNGLALGVLLWLAIIPSAAIAVLDPVNETVEFALQVATALALGGGVGYLLARSRSAVISCAAASLAMVSVTGASGALIRTGRGLQLLGGLAGVTLAFAIVFVLIVRFVSDRRTAGLGCGSPPLS